MIAVVMIVMVMRMTEWVGDVLVQVRGFHLRMILLQPTLPYGLCLATPAGTLAVCVLNIGSGCRGLLLPKEKAAFLEDVWKSGVLVRH